MPRRRGNPGVLGRVYHRGMCKTVLEVGKKGGTTNAMALACGVYRYTIHKWRRRHPEFAFAFERAKTEAEAFWEDVGQKNMENPNFNYGLWFAIMRRFEHPHWLRKHQPVILPVPAAVRVVVKE